MFVQGAGAAPCRLYGKFSSRQQWNVYHGASGGEKSEVWRQGSQINLRKQINFEPWAPNFAKLHLFFSPQDAP